ncbi:polysaccharide deacetylase family protein [Blastococcus tunisiensis]|uniref:Peptidoglycan/xylan/chitin deacetylase, PgdA/CDA1 family n=1 Tax=Blastococcus tunisiensis TaxID=1798228 RepID=A0A1I2DZP6_9ACTN|nr:polysaccharide deacetylase family protein [Blastococcus sp. DSM 46838]SFE86104.1 Peptidoglycan/xylan/chitin deacetylase, PgdA/CDA1 family [Blastococcus sp. DSM 46838]
MAGVARRVGPAAAVAAVLVLTLVGCGGGREDGRAAGTPTSASPTSASPTSSAPTSASPTSSAPAPSSGPTPGSTTPSAVPDGLRGRDVEVIPTTRRVVALTFDAGANSAGLPSILSTLAAEDVPATFFLTGAWARTNPVRAAEIRAAGHRIGNHSATHPNFTELSDEAIASEVLGAEEQIRAAGSDPRSLFRFPFGDRDARTIGVVNGLGYVAVRWTVDTLGWKGTGAGQTAQQVTDRAMAALGPGAIVLMHIGSNPDDGSTLDADALPGTIERMRAAGYGFVTLDELFPR